MYILRSEVLSGDKTDTSDGCGSSWELLTWFLPDVLDIMSVVIVVVVVK